MLAVLLGVPSWIAKLVRFKWTWPAHTSPPRKPYTRHTRSAATVCSLAVCIMVLTCEDPLRGSASAKGVWCRQAGQRERALRARHGDTGRQTRPKARSCCWAAGYAGTATPGRSPSAE